MRYIDHEDIFGEEKKEKPMRHIRMDEAEQKIVFLTKEQVLLALRSYIKSKVIPPRDATVEIKLQTIAGEHVANLDILKEVTITWNDSYCSGF